MTGQALLLLTRADECARAVLMDSYDAGVAGQIVRGLPGVLRSAAAVWDEIPTDQQPGDIATGTPLATAAMIAAHLEQGDVGRGLSSSDPRIVTIGALLDEAGSAIGDRLISDSASGMTRQTEAARLQVTVLHVGYVLTHAAANSATRQAALLADANPDLSRHFSLIATRIRGIEHMLDAHLHRPPQAASIAGGVRSGGDALDRVMRAAYQVGPSGNAASYLVLADIGRAVTGTTARLAIESVQRDLVPLTEVRDRLLPALQVSVRQWEASRQVWARLLAPADRPDPQLAVAGIQLQRELHHLDLPAHSGTMAAMTRVLTLASELAVLNHHGLASADRKAPAAVVARLTSEALDHAPAGVGRVRTWLSVERIEGSAPVSLPDVARDHLDRQGHATLDAALAARSAGHALDDRTGHHALSALQQDTTRPRHLSRELPRSGNPGTTVPRIG